jgi:hypothetical protein
MKKNDGPKIIKLSDQDLKDLQKKIETNKLGPKEKSIILNLLKVYLWPSKLYFAKKLSLRKLKRLFSFSTEKNPKLEDKKILTVKHPKMTRMTRMTRMTMIPKIFPIINLLKRSPN